MYKQTFLGSVIGACLLISGPALAEFSQVNAPSDGSYALGMVEDDGSVRNSIRTRIDTDPIINAGVVSETGIEFGDDSSEWANDGECDDPRFVGAGMTWTPLLEEDRMHDATDCAAAWIDGTIALAQSNPLRVLGVDFGDNSSPWAYDGECDDPRFQGSGMVHATPVETDLYRDAADCSALYVDGSIELLNSDVDIAFEPASAVEPEPLAVVSLDGIDFGDDRSQWALDGECDDPRFDGIGMTPTILLEEDAYHDATDCREQFALGRIVLAPGADGGIDTYAGTYNGQVTTGAGGGSGSTSSGGAATQYDNGISQASTVVAGIDFGDDRSQWSFDYECDDPRFAGPGMTSTALLNQDMYHDATDCHRAYVAGDIWLR